MKKIILLISFVGLFCISQAQITITSSNTPTAGHVANQKVDTLCNGITEGIAGANQTWDFTGLANHKEETIGFVVPSTLPGASSFPTANLGIDDASSQYQFVNSNSSEFNVLGFYGSLIGTMTPVILGPGFKLITFPSTYNTSYNYTYTSTVQVPYNQPPVDSIRINISGNISSIMDGWGIVSTPTYANVACLRQNFTEIVTNTMYIHMSGTWTPSGSPDVDTSYSFNWWSEPHNAPILELDKETNGVISEAKWLHSYLPGSVSTPEVKTVSNIKVYPNPVKDVLYVSGLTEASVIVITDITGKILSSNYLNPNKSAINISEYKNGVFIYSVIDIKGSILSKGKFIVVK